MSENLEQQIDFDGEKQEKLTELKILRDLIFEDLEGKARLAKEVILRDLSGESVLIFGENHIGAFRPLRELIYDLLPDLKEKGFTTLAIEQDKAEQDLIDKFLAGEVSSESVAEGFFISPILDQEQIGDWVRILERCKELGLSIKAIDQNPLEEAGEQGTADFENRRDETMYNELEEMTANGEKVIYIVGNGHLDTELQIAPDGKSKIKRLGCRSKEKKKNWILIEGISPSVKLTDTPNQDFYGRNLSEIGIKPLESKILYIKSSNKVFKEGQMGQLDCILFLPDIENEEIKDKNEN